MKNFLVPLAFLSLVSLCAGELGCNNTTPGVYNGVVCVSKTQYVWAWEDPETAEPMSCDNATVCADVPDICSSSAEPVCENTNPDSPGTCNKCIDEVPNRVCISNTTYSICNQGVILTNSNYTCPSSTPYCKAEFNTTANQTQVIEICTTDPANLDCGAEDIIPGPTPTPTPSPPTDPPTTTFNCTESGFFADPSSTDCTRYIKCQPKTTGGFDQLTYSCSKSGYKFNPSTQKCDENYTCP